MSNTAKIVLAVVVIVALAGVLFAVQGGQGGQSATSTVKVGVLAPLSGDASAYGESFQKAVAFAKKDLGADDIEIIYEDSKCSGKAAVNAANKLINVDNVDVILGEMCSSATLAVAPVANKNNVPIISPASTSPDLSDAGEYTFRTVPSDRKQGEFGAQLVYNDGHRRLAILHSQEDYGIGFRDVLQEEFPALGGEVVATQSFAKNAATDLRTQLSKIKQANPDAVYVISNAVDALPVALQQIDEMGIEAPVYGSEGFKSQKVISEAGESADGLIITSVSSGTDEFMNSYEQANGEEPGIFAAQSYDAFRAVHEAVQAGATDGESIATALREDVSFSGASGQIAFNEQGDVSGNYEVVVVENGEFVTSEMQ